MIILSNILNMTTREWYYVTAYFLLYSFLGWCVEVLYNVYANKRIVNRGFLNGSLCPIYGVGMLMVLLILYPVSDNLVVLYIVGLIFATVIELIGGAVLYRLFHMRWWDYTNERFNYRGYICLKFSLFWGAGIVLAVKLIHPVVMLNVYILDRPLGHFLILVCYLVFVADLIITTLTVAHMNKHLERLNRLAAELRSISNDMTEHLGEAAVEHMRIEDAVEVKDYLDSDAIRAKMDEIRELLIQHPHTGYGRLYQAFPSLSHAQFDEELKLIRERFQKRRFAINKEK